MKEADIKRIVHEAVTRALHPGPVDVRAYRHVDITDPDGTRWRGMVYRVEVVEEESEQSYDQKH